MATRTKSPTRAVGGNPCTATTSATISPSAAANGTPSLPRPSNCSVSISPPPAPAPLKPSCVSRTRAINPALIALLRQLIPSASDVAQEINDAWRGLDQRAAARERRGISYGRILRCPACKKFVASPRRCACGYDRDTGWAS